MGLGREAGCGRSVAWLPWAGRGLCAQPPEDSRLSTGWRSPRWPQPISPARPQGGVDITPKTGNREASPEQEGWLHTGRSARGEREWGGAGGAEPWHCEAWEDLEVGNCNSDLDKLDPWEEGAQSPRERVGEAEGIRSEAQVPEGGVGMAREGSSGRAWQHRKLKSGGPIPGLPGVSPTQSSSAPRLPGLEGPDPSLRVTPTLPRERPLFGPLRFQPKTGSNTAHLTQLWRLKGESPGCRNSQCDGQQLAALLASFQPSELSP